MTQSQVKLAPRANESPLQEVIQKASDLILSQQFKDGYWWYTLEANESINAEYIFLTHYLDCVDPNVEQGIIRRVISSQRKDGSWPIYYGGPGDISTTIECYLAVKMCGNVETRDLASLHKARQFILSQGGLTKCRVFTRIHLALFGLVSWDICPIMPVGLINLPVWFPINVYEFSSWARQSIIPLLVIMNQKKSRPLPEGFLDELYLNKSDGSDKSDRSDRSYWTYKTEKGLFSLERGLIELDKILKLLDGKYLNLLKKSSLKKCEKWVRDHLERTEDIYPALAYGALALSALGYSADDPMIRKALKALRSFQMPCSDSLNALPKDPSPSPQPSSPQMGEGDNKEGALYQQCCISPVWDTPWAGVALLEAGASPQSETLLKTGRWLLSKQIKDFKGDWAKKNTKTKPGGWSFEFQNDYFPDVDDAIQVLIFLIRLGQHLKFQIPNPKFQTNSNDQISNFQTIWTHAVEQGIKWLLSMQSKNGGFAAFDVDNTKEILNKIPFSDHGACLDQPTPDITGRMLEFLALINHGCHPEAPAEGSSGCNWILRGVYPEPDVDRGILHFVQNDSHFSPVIKKAINFIEKTQDSCDAWWGRWGVNYIYGTWCVLAGLRAIGYDMSSKRVQKAVSWLKSIQQSDGGYGESCHSYIEKKYVPLPESVPSQTAWALMGLIAGGEGSSREAKRAAKFLINRQNETGGWDEEYFTGTGFPGHFYIRYHGYRYYFPLLALARYRNGVKS